MCEVKNASDVDVFAELANVCEQINCFARSLRSENRFATVTTGTNLRIYQGQWMFEKFVEVILNVDTGETAVWWLDFSKLTTAGWRIHTNTSISYGDYDEDVDTATVPLDANLRQTLEGSVSALIATYAESAKFRRVIEQCVKLNEEEG